MRIDRGSRPARTRRTGEPRIPRWVHPILEVPLEVKLLGANRVLVGIAFLLLFGPVHLQPSRLTDAYLVVGVLVLGAAMNVALVRLALRPIKAIERVATSVSQGRFGERVPTSIVADRELARLSRTINGMLDSLAADRKRIERLGAELAYSEEKEGSHASRRSLPPSAAGITHGIFTSSDAG